MTELVLFILTDCAYLSYMPVEPGEGLDVEESLYTGSCRNQDDKSESGVTSVLRSTDAMENDKWNLEI
jgi:hypothetical protein